MATTFTYPTTVSMTGVATTVNSNLLTVAASAAGSWGVAIGATLSHANIPAGTTIVSYNSTTQAVMSANATVTGSSLTVTATNPSIINIDQVPSIVKTGGDIYNINGVTLLIDQDSRYGLNNGNTSATAATSMGAITVSSTLGGSLNIDGRYVRLIPYTGGSGNVPVPNTIISKGSASGKLIGVWGSLTSAPTASGSAMPASGFIKIKAWNGTPYTSGALTGITATASGADTAGWIDVIGDEAGTLTIPRLGQLNVTGEWYYLGTTTGANTGTYQVPNSGLTTYIPGVYVETAPSSGVYEFYPNAGSTTALAANFSRDWRSKVCFVTTAGVVRFGSDGTNSTGGYIPVSGCNIRIGNVILQNCVATTRNVNALPNATLATRYELATSASGIVNMDKASCGWYLNLNQPFAVNISNSSVFDNITATEVATSMTWSDVGVGQSAALANFALVLSLNFAGGTFSNCVFTAASLAASGRYILSIADINGFTFNNVKTLAYAIRGNATSGAATITRAVNCTWNNTIIGCGRFYLATTTNQVFNNTTYFDNQAVNTTATIPMYAFDLASGCLNTKIDGMNFGGLYYTQPYNGLLNIGAAGCTNTTLRNIGSYGSPLSLGAPRRDDQAWSRTTTTATVTTSTPHGLAVNDTIYVVVSSDIAAIVVGAKTVASVPSATTFTFTCLNAGSASGTVCFFGTKAANVFVLASGAAANGVRIQRVYAPHTRTNLFTGDNSSKNIVLENVFSDYLNIPVLASLNMSVKNMSGTPTLAVQTAVYGTHWFNGYTCDVANNTQNCTWTRSGTVVTVTSVGHSLRTTAASTSTAAQNIPISIITSSDEAAVPRGVQNFVTAINSSTFTITGVNAGATSGTLSYRVGNGRIGLVMNESTADTSNTYTFDSGNPQFTSAGTLYMPNIGDQVTFTTPDYILGQGDSFPIMELQIGGSTLTRYTFQYQIDKNDGNGYGGWHNLYYERAGGSGTSGQYTFTVTNATGVEIGDYVWGTGIANKTQVTNIAGNTITVDSPNKAAVSGIIRFNHLPSESNLGPTTGIKMKWRITTVTANTVPINFLYIFAESTDAGRQAVYPLDTITLTLTGVVAGSDIVILNAGTSNERANVDSNSGTTYNYVYETTGNVDIGVFKAGYIPFYIRNYALQSTNAILPIAQVADRNYGG